MYNRYQGNTGRFLRVEERQQPPREPARPAPAPQPQRAPGVLGTLGRLLPGLGEELETEDLLLLLILYLMYRETGDSDLLIVMGGVFLL